MAIGGTLDDALGEAFDKCARLLGIRTAGSGGAAIEQFAKKSNLFVNNTCETTSIAASAPTYEINVPMRDKPNCDFSYAGHY